MKKNIKTILTLLFISSVIFLTYQIVSKINHKIEIQQNIKTIPQFNYQDINGKRFTNKNLKKVTPVIFIYFNTECEYCNEEAIMIQENIQKFKDCQIIFISFEKQEQIEKFSKHYKLDLYNNVHFLHDSKVTFATTFDVHSLPCIVLYDKNQNLIEKIKGQIKPVILFKKLNIQ
ncbi:peroxiredoxin family protein [Flavobacterium notoginsengisoli]|uniref:peroxiredoxin family protein n=1 Tax=Flavobacterium notoginsengisoli TaxID=1478199 RepID=UPI00362C1C66